ncbi:uncharacterized protein LOC123549902 [Mercenaria mercenaria]|uniref:uncharacterized protein LOC123549902 n=1 Tax=Mercenaria mercenaria TaxID=6596 RepID=UPI00234F19B5|nr:uncharacterized protein LOC123549902 [Mercenaria mercenaria]
MATASISLIPVLKGLGREPSRLNFVILIAVGSVLPYKLEKKAGRLKRWTECKAPEVNVSTRSLENADADEFPVKDYKETLKSKQKWLKKFLKNRKEVLNETLSLEKNLNVYPECQFAEMCDSTRTVIDHWKVNLETNASESCWIAEAVVWTDCDMSHIPDFHCAKFELSGDFGVRCVPKYRRQTVWVYCSGSTKEIKPMTLTIPNACKAARYRCLDTE